MLSLLPHRQCSSAASPLSSYVRAMLAYNRTLGTQYCCLQEKSSAHVLRSAGPIQILHVTLIRRLITESVNVAI